MDSKVYASIFWFFARLFVGVVLAAAGFLKLIEPVENVTAILAAYPVISDNFAFILARALPWAELIFGSFLILGYALRIPAGVSSDSSDKLPLIPELTFHPRSEATLPIF